VSLEIRHNTGYNICNDFSERRPIHVKAHSGFSDRNRPVFAFAPHRASPLSYRRNHSDKKGYTLEEIGIGGMSPEEINRYVREY